MNEQEQIEYELAVERKLAALLERLKHATREIDAIRHELLTFPKVDDFIKYPEPEDFDPRQLDQQREEPAPF